MGGTRSEAYSCETKPVACPFRSGELPPEDICGLPLLEKNEPILVNYSEDELSDERKAEVLADCSYSWEGDDDGCSGTWACEGGDSIELVFRPPQRECEDIQEHPDCVWTVQSHLQGPWAEESVLVGAGEGGLTSESIPCPLQAAEDTLQYIPPLLALEPIG